MAVSKINRNTPQARPKRPNNCEKTLDPHAAATPATVLEPSPLTLGCGAMTDERWQSFYEGMRDVGLYPAGMDYKKAYSLEFVNKRVGLA